MFKLLTRHEIRVLLKSRKLPIVFGVSALLLSASVLVGSYELNQSTSSYETFRRLNDQEIQSADHWLAVRVGAYRKPTQLTAFVSGVSFDIGRFSYQSFGGGGELEHSVYSDDPLFAFFRFLDFAFVVQFILPLFAILFSYDRICGEREDGLLRLLMANAIPRNRVVLSKVVGALVDEAETLIGPVFVFHNEEDLRNVTYGAGVTIEQMDDIFATSLLGEG